MALNFLYRNVIISCSVNLSRARLYAFSSYVKHDEVCEEEETLKNNPYYRKYETKLKSAKKEKPLDYLERLKGERMKDQVEKVAEESTIRLQSMKEMERPKPNQSPLITCKSLNDIVKLDILMKKSVVEIQRIWREFHKNVTGLSAMVPGEIFKLIQERSKLYPIFLLPLPRKTGYEFIVCQFERNEVHFTQLLSWQTQKDNAPICMSLIYYSELLDSKDIAPMRGTYDRAVLSLLEAQCLANTLHLYYGEEHPKRTDLLDRFTNDPDNFKHMELIDEIENLTIKM